MERFVKEIGEDCCFICGKHLTADEFNDGHVMPEWILRKYDLFSSTTYNPSFAGTRAPPSWATHKCPVQMQNNPC